MSFQEPTERQDRKVPVGIDLGTTFSVIAYLDEAGQPLTIPNGAGDLITPSAIFVDEEEVIVGREAVRGSATAPGWRDGAWDRTWACASNGTAPSPSTTGTRTCC